MGVEDVCDAESVCEEVTLAEVEDAVALCVVDVATIPAVKAGSLICIIDWNAHFTPSSVVSLVNATVLVALSKRW